GKRANPVVGKKMVRYLHSRLSRVMTHVVNMSTQKHIAPPESNWFPAVIFFLNGVGVAAGIAPTFLCRQQ
ncbi:hypothetical protein DTH24_20435, partial [Salmonella enterica subsp. enterica serovar Urbana]|nr:hypothetical protein [Salmonella enterica subsp. enterica serovar Urbana]